MTTNSEGGYGDTQVHVAAAQPFRSRRLREARQYLDGDTRRSDETERGFTTRTADRCIGLSHRRANRAYLYLRRLIMHALPRASRLGAQRGERGNAFAAGNQNQKAIAPRGNRDGF